MNKNRKIEMLTGIVEGKPLEPLRATIMENSDTHTVVVMGSNIKELLNEQVNDYVAQLRRENPFRPLVVMRINRAEYEEISRRLEEEY